MTHQFFIQRKILKKEKGILRKIEKVDKSNGIGKQQSETQKRGLTSVARDARDEQISYIN